jgi:uncharacterized protein YdeI (YjbR/CyaY-like superfamily)
MPDFFAQALARHLAARASFDSLTRSCKRHYIDWLARAKREETRARRLAEALSLLEQSRRLPLK